MIYKPKFIEPDEKESESFVTQINESKSEEYARYVLDNRLKLSFKINDDMKFEVGQVITLEDKQFPYMNGEFVICEIDRDNDMITMIRK